MVEPRCKPAFATLAALCCVLLAIAPARAERPFDLGGSAVADRALPLYASGNFAADGLFLLDAADQAARQRLRSFVPDDATHDGPAAVPADVPAAVLVDVPVGRVTAEDAAEPTSGREPALPPALDPRAWSSPRGLGATVQMMLLLGVVSLAPAIVMMTTSFVRIIVVLGLLRQGLGTHQLPPNQVMTALALFMSLVVMTPVWTEVYQRAIAPYSDPDVAMSAEEAWSEGVRPVRKFMSDQIARTGNHDDVRLFLAYVPQAVDPATGSPAEYVYYGARSGQAEVPLQALLPAFLLSELKTAFLIGFQVLLPFLVIDLVVASVTMSMGMMMLPPMLISLPLKLLLFVLLDGWHLVVQMLLDSFQFAA